MDFVGVKWHRFHWMELKRNSITRVGSRPRFGPNGTGIKSNIQYMVCLYQFVPKAEK